MRTTHRVNDRELPGGSRAPQHAGACAWRLDLHSSLRSLLLAAACASAVLVGAVPAAAHGPCGCIKPTAATPGKRLVSTTPTIKIVWNPVRDDLLIGPDFLGRAHVAGQPRVVLQEQPQRGLATFAVPATAPGRYLVLLYDGTEGGMHYSWDYITVRSAPRSPASAQPTTAMTAPARRPDGLESPVVLGLAATLIALLGVGVFVGARKYRTDRGTRAERDAMSGR
jgi:hypothetical protein